MLPDAVLNSRAEAITRIDLPLPRFHSGKVREMFALDDDVLMVATDRLSAFDIVFEEGIPDKGRVLIGLSSFWFDHLVEAAPHHKTTIDVDAIVGEAPALAPFRTTLAGRAMQCRRADPIPVECVVRGWIDGSAWREYGETGAVCGIELPSGLRRGDALPEPIFTPSTKAREGHDENISYDRLVEIVGGEVAVRLRARSLALYAEGRDHAAACGLLLADTKFEFGWSPGAAESLMLLIDEIFTPDSSRLWDAATWSPGGAQPSFDKQPIRDFLDAERRAGRWNGEPPLPPLSTEAIAATRERYLEAYRRIVGSPLQDRG
jgi:phosphoribosylaminoimidazole-succinocarboxamide synthase